jgi:micrococcal nuclease
MKKTKRSRHAMSRRSRDFLFILAIAIAILAVVIDKTALRPVRRRIVESKQRGPDGQKYHGKTFTVVNVVDGDTFDLDIADGENDTTRIRPLGVDTPETVHPKYPPMYYGSEATEYTEELVLNKKVTIEIDTVSKSRDIYGRLLCFVRLDDGSDFGVTMIENGLAYADLRFEHGRYEKYTQLQLKAVKARVGLWDKVEKKQFPKWLQRKYPKIIELRPESP